MIRKWMAHRRVRRYLREMMKTQQDVYVYTRRLDHPMEFYQALEGIIHHNNVWQGVPEVEEEAISTLLEVALSKNVAEYLVHPSRVVREYAQYRMDEELCN